MLCYRLALVAPRLAGSFLRERSTSERLKDPSRCKSKLSSDPTTAICSLELGRLGVDFVDTSELLLTGSEGPDEDPIGLLLKGNRTSKPIR